MKRSLSCGQSETFSHSNLPKSNLNIPNKTVSMPSTGESNSGSGANGTPNTDNHPHSATPPVLVINQYQSPFIPVLNIPTRTTENVLFCLFVRLAIPGCRRLESSRPSVERFIEE